VKSSVGSRSVFRSRRERNQRRCQSSTVARNWTASLLAPRRPATESS
jgi:hypothetical protein